MSEQIEASDCLSLKALLFDSTQKTIQFISLRIGLETKFKIHLEFRNSSEIVIKIDIKIVIKIVS